MKIWCLFSVENNYDQPDHNLVAWWKDKPSFNTLATALDFGSFPCETDEATLYVVNLWQGKGGQVSPGSTFYDLVEVEEGVLS